MLQIRAFRPFPGVATQNLAVTTSPQTLTLNYQIGTTAVRICNVGTQPIFFTINDAQDTYTPSVTTSVIVPAGNTEVFTLGNGAVSMSFIAAATGSTVYITQGEGL